MSILKQSLILPTFMLLSACGGGDSCSPSDGRPLDTTSDTSKTCAVTRAANSIVIAYPTTDAIEQLAGNNSAIYSRKGSVIATDQNGNAVPDGTAIQLDVIDSIIAGGTIAGVDTISGTTLTDADPLEGDGTTATPTDFTTAAVNRLSDSNRVIKVGDIIILNNAPNEDRIRYVSAITANSLTVSTSYNNTYPSAAYPGATYSVGQELVGVSIIGFDASGNKTPGVTFTQDGVGAFVLEYPGDAAHLNYGSSSIDPRYSPLGSTRVWVTATFGTDIATAGRTVLSSIAPATLAVNPTELGSSAPTTITIRDASAVPLALYAITATSSDPTVATSTDCAAITDIRGQCSAFVTVIGADGSTATITYSNSSGSIVGTVQVTVPTPVVP